MYVIHTALPAKPMSCTANRVHTVMFAMDHAKEGKKAIYP